MNVRSTVLTGCDGGVTAGGAEPKSSMPAAKRRRVEDDSGEDKVRLHSALRSLPVKKWRPLLGRRAPRRPS